MHIKPLLAGMLIFDRVAGSVTAEPETMDKNFNNTTLSDLNTLPKNMGRGSFFAQMLGFGLKQTGIDVQEMAPVEVFKTLPLQTNQQPAGHAARIFQEKFQEQALAAPGTVLASRADLGLKENQVVMVDIGGEGQKTSREDGLKSGSAHAINLNAQPEISSTPIDIALKPHGPRQAIGKGFIPNLIRPAKEWPDSDHKGPLFPLAKGFSNLSLMEGAPVYDYHVEELARITSKKGWIVLAVSDSFEEKIHALAKQHNDGTVWKLSDENGFGRYVLPPQIKADQTELQDQFKEASSHDLFGIVEKLQNAPARAP